ncbi:hypothetical protein [Entomomonas asaccharolytica]|uniref:Receptor-recognising protein Gp38 domain-containing protein n=2 Tax=Entomomonas asaccharolytica TaxID=2785331 RepID=A0A974NE56_9GAMM|nr:hypothetical protein [Entomomonas asaccharolytica]QQP85003.1 hypothetical protein JHT90_11475 [Entomomonas asaccharolytica]
MILVKLAWNNAYHKVNKIILNLNGKMHEVKKGVINIGDWGRKYQFFPLPDGNLKDDQLYHNPVDQTLYNITLSSLFDMSKLSKNFVLVNEGIIGSQDITKPALLIDDNFPEGSMVTILNIGYIVGKGGHGIPPLVGGKAYNGGDAIRNGYKFTQIQNFAVIGGGGGGGATARGFRIVNNNQITVGLAHGGGGAGEAIGTTPNGNGAIEATIETGGKGQTLANGYTIAGGKGGDLGQNGSLGSVVGLAGDGSQVGLAGYAISYPNTQCTPDYLNQGGQLLGINGIKA